MPFVEIVDNKIHSAKLEYNLVDHCNLSCSNCSHFSPHLKSKYALLETFKCDLEALARVYKVTRFRFVGGEPLLHKQILEFIAVVKSSGIADKIQICTNGVLLDRVDDEVFRQIDMLSVSWYPDMRVSKEKIDFARQKCRNFDTEYRVKKINRFRLMQLQQRNESKLVVKKIYRSCEIAHSWGCQTIYDGYFYLCSRPIFTQKYLSMLGEKIEDLQVVDGVNLYEPNLANRLKEYLTSQTPLSSCEFCLGTSGKEVPWSQMTLNERRVPVADHRSIDEVLSMNKLLLQDIWSSSERTILNMFPSTKVARGLSLIRNVLNHW